MGDPAEQRRRDLELAARLFVTRVLDSWGQVADLKTYERAVKGVFDTMAFTLNDRKDRP